MPNLMAQKAGIRHLVAASLILSICACNAPPPDETPVMVDGAVAATVNGDKIYVSDVELEAVARGLVSAGQQIGPGNADYDSVLNQLVEEKLMAQEALRRGLDKDPASQRRLARARDRILGNLLVESVVAEQVTEDDIEKMYKEQVALQQDDDQVLVAHILVDTQEEAQQLFDRIQAGENFESLVVSHSKDSATRMEKGSLGYVSPNDEPEPFPEVIANTGVGEVSPPFKADDGWHILKVKDRRSKPPQTRDQMRPEIVTFLTFEQMAKLIRRLKAEAHIAKGEPALDAVPATPYRLPDTGDGGPPDETPAPKPPGTEL
ncbi:MAG TPA: peptidylprolyl isomerase [Hyphomonas sp.]|nr:peptidylprolyl isomerase [Hyphomonas sp.]MCB9963063.1 peptidylprolyl isomerase [Hyphomonas sp.]MCB9972454.1 peptidylprolyl isomerase [Hyphomonas sp.]MCC0017699.1 peptidylprolyl isomerase [Rhodobiaceae bacterium]HPE47830.1 peptidylprolyl isomerase [Hyphomonas sp.]